jgi:predicted acetyltransferase
MQLVKPTKEYADSWEEALIEFNLEGTGGFWKVPAEPTDIVSYIQTVEDHEQGVNLPEYWVPATTFWLIDNSRFVGHVNIRHELTKKLQQEGGHIGYAIRPSERRKGRGSEILRLALIEAKRLELERALLTCDDVNIGSQKIIEKNGGVLQDTIQYEGKLVRRYWIGL